MFPSATVGTLGSPSGRNDRRPVWDLPTHVQLEHTGAFVLCAPSQSWMSTLSAWVKPTSESQSPCGEPAGWSFLSKDTARSPLLRCPRVTAWWPLNVSKACTCWGFSNPKAWDSPQMSRRRARGAPARISRWSKRRSHAASRRRRLLARGASPTGRGQPSCSRITYASAMRNRESSSRSLR